MQGNKRTILLYQKEFGKTAKKAKKNELSGLTNDGFRRNPNLLMSAYNCWNSLSAWRKDIIRNEEFVFGDQFSDRVYDAANCRVVTERRLLMDQGLNPSQYNIIRNVVRTIVGVWSSNKTLPSCIAQKDENQEESEMLTATLHALYRKNELWKFDMAELSQLLITGAAISDNAFACRSGEKDVVNDFIDPFAFFVDNNMKDPRYTDCSLVGYFYNCSLSDIVGMFSKGSKRRAEKIRGMYGQEEERIYELSETFTDQRLEKDFFIPNTEAYGLHRVIKIWRKESAECYWIHDYLHGAYYPDFEITEARLNAENARRKREQGEMGVAEEDMLLLDYEWGTSTFWKYYFLTPYGEVLDEGMNPYWHEKPSIVFELHDFFCGKIYPFIKDLIDTQKQINQLSAISTLLSKFSAKSLMFIPVESIATDEGYGMEYIQKAATSYDAIIPYKAKGNPNGHKPEYTNTIAQAFTPLNVVNMYLKLSENVSGVYGALQGQQPTAGTPAQMYAQQSMNSATSLNGIFESINSFRVRRDKMNVQLMQQYYDSKKYVFDKNSGRRLVYDPAKVKNIETEIAIVENTNTPAYRLMVNDTLLQLKQFDPNNVLDLRGILETGSFPFKDKLLDYINKREQEIREAAENGMPYEGQPMPPDLQNELSRYQFSPELLQQLEGLPVDVQEMVVQQATQGQGQA